MIFHLSIKALWMMKMAKKTMMLLLIYSLWRFIIHVANSCSTHYILCFQVAIACHTRAADIWSMFWSCCNMTTKTTTAPTWFPHCLDIVCELLTFHVHLRSFVCLFVCMDALLTMSSLVLHKFNLGRNTQLGLTYREASNNVKMANMGKLRHF